MTFTGDATMWMTVFADIDTSLLVVGNGLRVLKKEITYAIRCHKQAACKCLQAACLYP